ncbi:MAG: hypothetical protein QME51_04180 [Planctomycetota bacterium]|nr:hypothetical protein [Planctomycetota bacterium]
MNTQIDHNERAGYIQIMSRSDGWQYVKQYMEDEIILLTEELKKAEDIAKLKYIQGQLASLERLFSRITEMATIES